MGRYSLIFNIFVFVILVNLISYDNVEAYKLLRYYPEDLQQLTWKYMSRNKKTDDNQTVEVDEVNSPQIIYTKTLPNDTEIKVERKKMSTHNTIVPEFKRLPTNGGMKILYGFPSPGQIIILPNENNVFGYRGKP